MRSIAALLSAAALLAGTPVAAGPNVRAPAGTLEGATVGGVDRFLGIPYAAAPIGPNRWRSPAAPARWTGVRLATEHGADCVQDSAHNPLPVGYRNRQSEDCLFLNIWRPAHSGTRRPVMVWIHGGAFIMGSGSLPDYAGAYLAGQGVIVVTLNYRLGRFGTFAHPALLREQADEPTANYGMMDQLAALRWVRDNIAAFGGDPANVTIFGESAGATSVNFLMASPAARGLFAKAISQSGGRYDRLTPLTGDERSAAAQGERWAATKGAHDAAALRALSAEQVLDAPVTAVAAPVLDGRIVVAPTDRAFRDGLVAPVPYLLGANDYEESLLRWMPGAAGKLVAELGVAGPPLLAHYADAAEPAARLWGEAAMVEPARWRAKQHARHGQPVWLYRFGYVPATLRADRAGAGHADEVPFVLGNPAGPAANRWTEADRAVAQQVSAYWVAFARSGDPNHAGAPAWPRVAPSADRLMLFGAGGPTSVTDFGRARLDRIEAALGPDAPGRPR